jgi:hypothetical protein
MRLCIVTYLFLVILKMTKRKIFSNVRNIFIVTDDSIIQIMFLFREKQILIKNKLYLITQK